MTILEPNNTYAMLIGIPNYKEGDPATNLPAAFNNITDFKQSLIENLSLKDSNIENFYGGSKNDVLSYLTGILQNDDCKNILIYYAGHGIPDNKGNTYLSFSDMKINEYSFKGLKINEISEIINDTKQNTNVILFLDCCFSQRSLKGINLKSFFALAAASTNQAANFPLNQTFSSFYQAIKNVQSNGIDFTSPTISLSDLFSEVKTLLNNQDAHKALNGELDLIAFCKNKYKAVTIPVHEEIKPILIKLFKTLCEKNYISDISKKELAKFIQYDQRTFFIKLRRKIITKLPYPLGLLLNAYTVTSNEIDRAIKIKDFFDTSIKFIAIIMLSQLQEKCKSGRYKNKYAEIIKSMTNFPAHDPCYYIKLIKDINQFFIRNKINPFLEDLNILELASYFQSNDSLQSKSLASFSNEDALEYEKLLWNYIATIHSLTKYTLVSVCSVGINNKSFDQKSYIHNGSIFEGNSENNYVLLLAFTGTRFYTNTHTVLLVKDLQDNKQIKQDEIVNLWPFVIDKNCFDSVIGGTPRIYLMTEKATGNGYYSYLSVKKEKTMYTEIDPVTEIVDRQFGKFNQLWQ